MMNLLLGIHVMESESARDHQLSELILRKIVMAAVLKICGWIDNSSQHNSDVKRITTMRAGYSNRVRHSFLFAFLSVPHNYTTMLPLSCLIWVHRLRAGFKASSKHPTASSYAQRTKSGALMRFFSSTEMYSIRA